MFSSVTLALEPNVPERFVEHHAMCHPEKLTHGQQDLVHLQDRYTVPRNSKRDSRGTSETERTSPWEEALCQRQQPKSPIFGWRRQWRTTAQCSAPGLPDKDKNVLWRHGVVSGSLCLAQELLGRETYTGTLRMAQALLLKSFRAGAHIFLIYSFSNPHSSYS